MAVIGAMFSGISGLNANSVAMEIIGNNLANMNTPGFKYSRADFQDVMAKIMSQGLTIGRGSVIGGSTMVFSQGGFETTDNATDLALSGEGFFMVRDTLNNGSFYTRAGAFKVDSTGYLVNSSGYRVQGFALDANGEIEGLPTDILIPTAPMNPVATTEITMLANLDADAEYVGPFDLTDPDGTSNFATAITVYDSLGSAHQVTTYFTKAATAGPGGGGLWNYNVVVGADDATGGAAYIASTGTLEFSTSGALQAHTPGASANFNFVGNVTQGQVIEMNFGTPIADGGTGLDGTTQFSDTSAIISQRQDGYAPSYMESLAVNEDGIVYGQFANGKSQNFARIAVVNFANPNGLNQLGSSMFSETTLSGEPVVSVANVSGNGSIFSNNLELANTDIAGQFVSLITTQRAYQAASRAITTANEMMSESINMTR